MARIITYAAICCVLTLCWGCGAPQKRTSTDHEETSWDAEPRNDERPGDVGEGPGEPSDEPGYSSDTSDPGPRPAAVPEDYEMTHGDCQALAQHYYDVILAEQLNAIPPNLKPNQRKQAEKQAEKNAQEGQAQWQGQCQGIVGQVYSREWLECAMKAKKVKRFTDCVTGKVQPSTSVTP